MLGGLARHWPARSTDARPVVLHCVTGVGAGAGSGVGAGVGSGVGLGVGVGVGLGAGAGVGTGDGDGLVGGTGCAPTPSANRGPPVSTPPPVQPTSTSSVAHTTTVRRTDNDTTVDSTRDSLAWVGVATAASGVALRRAGCASGRSDACGAQAMHRRRRARPVGGESVCVRAAQAAADGADGWAHSVTLQSRPTYTGRKVSRVSTPCDHPWSHP